MRARARARARRGAGVGAHEEHVYGLAAAEEHERRLRVVEVAHLLVQDRHQLDCRAADEARGKDERPALAPRGVGESAGGEGEEEDLGEQERRLRGEHFARVVERDQRRDRVPPARRHFGVRTVWCADDGAGWMPPPPAPLSRAAFNFFRCRCRRPFVSSRAVFTCSAF
jgi:hypothetical protein